MTRVNCPECDKTFRKESGLVWHLERTHRQAQQSAVFHQPSEQQVSERQPVSLLEGRLQKLEFATGLREAEPASEGFLLVRETTLPEQLTELTKQVSDLQQQTNKQVSQLVEEREYYSRALEDLREKFEVEFNSLAAIVNKYRDAFNHNLADMDSRIDKVQKMIQDLGQGLNEIRTKLATHGHDNLKSIPELVAKVGKIEQTLGSMQSQVDYLGRVAKREPTGDTERIRLTNGQDHTFRVYKGKKGLSNPHRVSIDPFLGDKYVDLAEPED